MRPFLPRLACMIFTGIAVLSAPAHAQDITSNLVARWTLNETSGNTLYDSVGAVNGTTHGSLNPATRSIAGVFGSALYFDGSGDYANFGTGNLNMGTQSMTISMWIRQSACSTPEAGLLTKRFNSTGADGYSLRINCLSGNRRVEAALGGAAPTTYHVTGTNTVPLNTWVHVAGVWNRAGNMTVYLNGVADASLSIAAENGLDIQNTDPLLMGYLGAGSTSDFNGSIDDVRVYTRALSAADIAALAADQGFACASPNGKTGQMTYNTDYNRMQYCNGTQWVAIGKGSAQITGTVGHWKLDEQTGNTISDATGNGYNGTWTDGSGNNVAEETMNGRIGHALNFDGSNDRITLGSPALLNAATESVTVSAWIRPTAYGSGTYTNPRILSRFNGNANTGIEITIESGDSNNLHFRIADTASTIVNVDSNYTPPLNDWTHVLGVFESGVAVRIYINGVLSGTTATAVVTQYVNPANNLLLGARTDLCGNCFYRGQIDDVRIYNRALTASEIDTIYNFTSPTCTAPPTTNLVAHWQMDETNGGAVADISGNGNNGTWIDGANNDVTEETIAGQIGTAMSFNDTSNQITVPHSASLNVNTGYTVSGWMYFDSTEVTTISPGIIGKNLGGGWGHGWVLGRASGGGNIVGGKIRMAVQHNRNISGPNSSYSDWIFPVDTWNYVTITWDGSFVRYYLNGAYRQGHTLTVAPDTASGDLSIGYAVSNWGGDHFKGNLDDLRIYNRALSTNEVASLYGTLGGSCTVQACANPLGLEGAITYNTSHHVMQYCDGTNWIAMGKAGDGGASCNNPSGTAGTLFYNTSYNLYQYCEGDEWVSVGQIDPCDHNPSAGTTCQSGMIYVGDTPDGNIPMYMTSITHESGNVPWDTTAIYEVTGATSTTDGDDNTDILIARPTAYGAAQYCDNLTAHGHSDWYLPAIDELNLIWNAGTPLGDIRTDGTTYWSSTENGNTTSHIQRFNDGTTSNFDKNVYTRARCVRTGVAPPPTTGNLLAHWKLDETAGTTATDENALNHGTMTGMDGASNTVSGQDGTALSFAASSRITAAVTTTEIDDIFNEGTIAYWVYPTNWGTFGRVIDKSDAGIFPPDSGWHTQGTTGLIKFSQAFSGTYGDWETGAGTVPMNQWSHIVISYDNSSAANVPSFYINGVLSPTTTITAPSGTAVSDAANPITIGSRQGGGNNYTGYIDDIQMYDYILNATEIQDLYDSYTPPAPANELIGHWKLDETTGTTAVDSSASGFDGTMAGGLTADANSVTGRDGTAITFDGSNDVITIPHDNAQNPAAFSYAAWFYADDISGPHPHIIDKQSASAGYGLFLNGSNGWLHSYIYTDSSINFSSGSVQVTAGQWYHAVATYDGTTHKVYLNGAEISSDVLAGTFTPSTNDFRIGGRYSNDLHWNGRIDDVRLYNYALSAADVTALYNSYPPEADPDLVGHWRLDETTGNLIADSSNSNIDGTWNDGVDNDVTGETGAGVLGTSLDFDGSNDVISLGDNFDIAGEMTVCAWAYPEPGTTGYVFGKFTTSNNTGFFLRASTGSTWIMGTDIPNHISSGTRVDNTWQHVCAVVDPAPGTSTLYKDGVAIGSNTTTPAHTANNIDATIGNRYDNGRQFNGRLDDVRVYSRALTAAEILDLYNTYTPPAPTNGLVAHWTMDETSGTTLTDSSGNGYNAAMLGGMDAATSTVAGRVGTALHFDGVDNRIDVGSISEILGSQHVTISAWLKRDAANDYVHFWGGGASAASLGIGYYSTTLWTGVNDGSGGNQHATQSGAANDTNWHHVVMVYDGTQTGNTNRLKLYVDNVQATLNYNTAVPATMHNDAGVNMIIGSYGSGRSRGSIDDLRVYNRTLTPAEISALYDLGN